jgi:mutator protein MutT
MPPGPNPPPSPGPIDVAAAILFHEGRLLITRRPDAAHLGGLWEFPGGKREPGEGWEACLCRELREELGIEIEVGALLDDFTHSYPERPVRLRFYRVRLLSGTPRPLGCADLKWVTREELPHHQFPPADARLIDRLSNLWVKTSALGRGPG